MGQTLSLSKFFHLDYNLYQLIISFAIWTDKGIIKATGKNLPSKPHRYGHICKRINSNLNVNITNENTDDDIIASIDSIAGIKITHNRGHQWMDKKWNVHKRKKGYVKIHVAVNIKKTKEILVL